MMPSVSECFGEESHDKALYESMLTVLILSSIDQQHCQPNQAAVDHPPAWSADNCWRCATLFVVCHMDTLSVIAKLYFLQKDLQ